MASIDLSGTLKALKGQRTKVREDLAKLDKAIAAVEGLSEVNAASANRNGGRWAISVAGRRRIAQAQKQRWAKLKKKQAAKN
jgi:hypothetical protein